MDSARSWFQKFQPRERLRSSSKKKETSVSVDGSRLPAADEAPSNATRQKVAAAKQYIEKHYKEQMKSLQERRERYFSSGYFGQFFYRFFRDFLLPSFFLGFFCLVGHHWRGS